MFSLLAAAAVVSLSCQITGPTQINLVVDEGRGVTSFEVPATGHSRDLPTTFNLTSIVADMGRTGDVLVVDRQTLSYREEARGMVMRSGVCEIVKTPERKF